MRLISQIENKKNRVQILKCVQHMIANDRFAFWARMIPAHVPHFETDAQC